MNTTEFRNEVEKIMPGYKWTVQRPYKGDNGAFFKVTGIQSAGFNRMSTLEIVRREEDGVAEYEVKIAGYGTRGPWAATCKRETLARALRNLQEQCSAMMRSYNACVAAMIIGRTAKADTK